MTGAGTIYHKVSSSLGMSVDEFLTLRPEVQKFHIDAEIHLLRQESHELDQLSRRF